MDQGVLLEEQHDLKITLELLKSNFDSKSSKSKENILIQKDVDKDVELLFLGKISLNLIYLQILQIDFKKFLFGLVWWLMACIKVVLWFFYATGSLWGL